MHGLAASLLFSTCGADSAVVDWTTFQKEITVGGDQCVYSTNGEVSYEGTLEYKDDDYPPSGKWHRNCYSFLGNDWHYYTFSIETEGCGARQDFKYRFPPWDDTTKCSDEESRRNQTRTMEESCASEARGCPDGTAGTPKKTATVAAAADTTRLPLNVDGAGQTQTGTSGTGLSIGDRVEVTWRGKGHTAIVAQVYPETNAVDVVYEADGSVGRYLTAELYGLKLLTAAAVAAADGAGNGGTDPNAVENGPNDDADNGSTGNSTNSKKIGGGLIATIVMLVVILPGCACAWWMHKQKAGGNGRCKNTALVGGSERYCRDHTCSIPGCANSKSSKLTYCPDHLNTKGRLRSSSAGTKQAALKGSSDDGGPYDRQRGASYTVAAVEAPRPRSRSSGGGAKEGGDASGRVQKGGGALHKGGKNDEGKHKVSVYNGFEEDNEEEDC
eukprot:gene15700-47_t